MIRLLAILGLALGPLVACAPRAGPEPVGERDTPTDARDAPDSDVELGRTIARTVCARCHAIEPGQPSPHPSAPAFPTLARRLPPDALLPLLENGVSATHPDMPEIRLAPREIDPFLAFWSAL